MSKSVEEARRELFEAAITLPQTVKWCNEQKKYIGQNFWLADYAFEAWKAALDSVVVELPKEPYMAQGMSYPSYRDTVNSCRDAIHAAGVKTK